MLNATELVHKSNGYSIGTEQSTTQPPGGEGEGGGETLPELFGAPKAPLYCFQI